MIPADVVQNFTPAADTEIQIDDQTVVSVSAGTLIGSNGDAVTDSATAMVSVLDATRNPAVMPGTLEAWNAETQTAGPIESFGALDVGFTDAAGDPLNLAPGSQASISIPLSEGRRPETSPATVPLFYWSDAQGYWIEEGEAALEEVAPGRWAYSGRVSHFSTWNADVLYESVTLSGCVTDENGNPVYGAQVTARGLDYVGNSEARTNADGSFELQARPDSEVELTADAEPLVGAASTIRTGTSDSVLAECVVIESGQGLSDFNAQISGATGDLELCVRDHACEDGDKIAVEVAGRSVFSGGTLQRLGLPDAESGSGA